MKKTFKKYLALALALVMCLSIATPFTADDFILIDGRANFIGRENGLALQNLANFDDISGAWPFEAVARGVALDALSGDALNFRTFRPNDNLTRQEALNIVMRVAGLSSDAAQRGSEVIGAVAAFPTSQAMLDTGYSLLAMEMGIIPVTFPMFGNITREEFAYILHNALQSQDDIFETEPAPSHIYNFADWRSINPDYLLAIEVIAANQIMRGTGIDFNPTGALTRAEMAQVISNLGDIYLSLMGLESRQGAVAEIRNFTEFGSFSREIYIRQIDGTVDVLEYTPGLDAVVFNNGTISGLMGLEVNHSIEYIVHTETDTVWYVLINGQATEDIVEGQLFSLEDGVVTLRFPDESRQSYSVIDGLISTVDGRDYILMDLTRHAVANLPFGQNVRLYLRDGVIIRMSFIGTPELHAELRALVVQNNPDFGYMVVIDASGSRIVLRYYEQEMMVSRISHWDHNDLGMYIGNLFPSFAFNPRATRVADIVPGDIVFVRFDDADPSVIASISAISNYIMRYGRIVTLTHHEDHMSMLIEHENGQTSWFEVANDTFITRAGRRVHQNTIMVGDWARFLVNEAVLAPGHMLTSVIEMTIEGDARHISSIVRGNLSGINTVQNEIVLEHSQILHQTGWTNFREIGSFSIANPSISYFYNNRPISRTEALRMFGRGTADVYLALKNHFAGERVAMVSFRTAREEVLPADTVISTNASGQIWLAGTATPINTDEGTIVRRHGRLVSGLDVFAGDHASIILNGAGQAAVIDISNAPDTSQLQIFRARIDTVNDAHSFTVTSMSQLFGHNWVFAPIQRQFVIDTRTIFMPYGHTLETFRTGVYNTVADQVFTIVSDGTRAAYVIEHPFANRALRGTIDHTVAADAGNLVLRNVTVQDPVTNRWEPLSNVNTTITINVDASTLIGRNNALIPVGGLQQGDQVLVMTEFVDRTPEGQTMGSAYGRIILVD